MIDEKRVFFRLRQNICIRDPLRMLLQNLLKRQRRLKTQWNEPGTLRPYRFVRNRKSDLGHSVKTDRDQLTFPAETFAEFLLCLDELNQCFIIYKQSACDTSTDIRTDRFERRIHSHHTRRPSFPVIEGIGRCFFDEVCLDLPCYALHTPQVGPIRVVQFHFDLIGGLVIPFDLPFHKGQPTLQFRKRDGAAQEFFEVFLFEMNRRHGLFLRPLGSNQIKVSREEIPDILDAQRNHRHAV